MCSFLSINMLYVVIQYIATYEMADGLNFDSDIFLFSVIFPHVR